MKALKQQHLKALKQQLASILAQAKGARYDRVASGFVAVIGLVAAAAPFVKLIPGQTGLEVAGLCAFAGAFLPRATRAAGILNAAYGQQKPLAQVLPELWATLMNGPSIIAEAKAAEAEAAAKEKQQQHEASLQEAIQEGLRAFGPVLVSQAVAELNKTNMSGIPAGQLGKAEPAPADKQTPSNEQIPAEMPAPPQIPAQTPAAALTGFLTALEPLVVSKLAAEDQKAISITGGNQ